MEENTGPGPAPGEPTQPDFKVDAVGLVSRTFGLWARRLAGYISISAIAAIGLTVMEILVFYLLLGPDGLSNVGTVATDPASFALSLLSATSIDSFFFVMAVLMLVEMVVYGVVGGAMTKLAMDNYGSRGSGSVGESVSFAFGRLPTLIGAQIAFGLISAMLLAPLVFMSFYVLSVGVYTPGVANLALTLLAVMIVSLAAVVYVVVRFAPLIAVVIGTDLSAVQSLKRSFSITSHRFWHIFGGRVLLLIVVMIGSLVINIVFLGLTIFSSLFITIIYSVTIGLLLNPLDYIFQAVLYKDLMSRAATESQQQLW